MKKPILLNLESFLIIEPEVFLRFIPEVENMEDIHHLMQSLTEHFKGKVELAQKESLLLSVPNDIEFLVSFCYYCMLTLGIQITIGDQTFAYNHYDAEESANLEATIIEFRKMDQIKWDDYSRDLDNQLHLKEHKLRGEEPEEYLHDGDDDGFAFSTR